MQAEREGNGGRQMKREDGGVTGKSDGLMKAVAVAGMLLALLALPGGQR